MRVTAFVNSESESAARALTGAILLYSSGKQRILVLTIIVGQGSESDVHPESKCAESTCRSSAPGRGLQQLLAVGSRSQCRSLRVFLCVGCGETVSHGLACLDSS